MLLPKLLSRPERRRERSSALTSLLQLLLLMMIGGELGCSQTAMQCAVMVLAVALCRTIWRLSVLSMLHQLSELGVVSRGMHSKAVMDPVGMPTQHSLLTACSCYCSEALVAKAGKVEAAQRVLMNLYLTMWGWGQDAQEQQAVSVQGQLLCLMLTDGGCGQCAAAVVQNVTRLPLRPSKPLSPTAASTVPGPMASFLPLSTHIHIKKTQQLLLVQRVYRCRDTSELVMQSPEGPASPSSAQGTPGRHGASLHSPVRRPPRNALFPSPQHVSTLLPAWP